MKTTDMPTPLRVPKKRRALMGAEDVHLAEWLDPRWQPPLSPSDRRRVEEERQRRREERKRQKFMLAVLMGREGATPAQKDALLELVGTRVLRGTLSEVAYTQALGPRVDARRRMPGFLSALLEVAPKLTFYDVDRIMVRDANLVVALPREPRPPDNQREVSYVWEQVRYARHRGVSVTVVLPGGEVKQEGQ